MFGVTLQRWFRNRYYHRKGKENAYFLLFHQMYQYNNQPFPWIHRCYENENIFLATHFLSPALAKYSGMELALFTANHLACYWLPGGQSGAKGHVPLGDYQVRLHLFDELRTTYLSLEKTEPHEIQLKKISHSKETNEIPYEFLACNALNYQLFEPELCELIHCWLDYMKGQALDEELAGILEQCKKQSGLKEKLC